MTDSDNNRYDVCVVGSGPAGVAAALELADRGLSVVLLESGTAIYMDAAQKLSDAEIVTPASHSTMEDAVRRGLGGTSVIWGGRCVPLDAIDYMKRDFVDGSGWPITANAVTPYYQRASELLSVEAASYSVESCLFMNTQSRTLSENFKENESILATRLERWSKIISIWETQKAALQSHPKISVLPNTTCIGFRQKRLENPVIAALIRATDNPHAEVNQVTAKCFIIACGGVESTRLVLNSMRDSEGLKLLSPNLVGRYYMGHPSGKIADIELFGAPSKTIFGFERDGEVYVRRRITFTDHIHQQEKLLNIAFWLDNAPLADWRHGSAVLSSAYLALTTPFLCRYLAPAAIRKRIAGIDAVNRWRHVWNCLRNPWQAVSFSIGFVYKRYFATPRLPGFFTYSSNNRYALHYHAEQAPSWDSSIGLSDESDVHGLLRAKIALNWSQQDIDSIIRAHSVLDKALRTHNIGRLVYRYSDTELQEAITEQAVDGFHQIGTLRMAANPSEGVTDSFGLLYGTPNVYIASSAIFSTSGQANPTLTMVALAIRQAEHIASLKF